VVASGSPAHETNIRATTDNAALSIIPFFIVNGLFTSNSSQVASADVLGQQILSFRPEYERVTVHSVRYTARILAFVFTLFKTSPYPKRPLL
jgi:hypothetical protein